MSFHLAPLAATGTYWLDDSPDLSCKDSTRQHAVDDLRLSCKQQALCLGRGAGGRRPRATRWPGGIVRRLVDKMSDGLGV
ncbi:MAG: hypothetical protein ACRD08_00860 [Acidimicrobiales bacterium]